MLNWIIKDRRIRLYDISSIIIFSASVNIVTWGITLEIDGYKLPSLLIGSFFSLIYSGWCCYWLSKEVERYIQSVMRIESAAINKIKESGMSSLFKRQFISAIFFLFWD